MKEDIDYALIGLWAMIIAAIMLLSAATGWEAFKLTHNVVCWEEIGRCVAAPWS